MPMLTHTATRTHATVTFADPYKKCLACKEWVDGFVDGPGMVLVPCGHREDYRDVCPSWSPVDGCRCAEYNARHPHDRIFHEVRAPKPGDDRRY